VPKGDVAQRPGTFVIARDGTVAFAHYNKDSSDNPATAELLRVVKSL
jgi:peroxiredoxin